ncbi:hypothetical protein LDO31_10795 [Luteimonas sp. XNQY3]|nr:hypothetical protein [Luteimonas sp. XNQY3]MCD9006714.1 hypothetical protein [Luteimonas sp. XNQY3]
MRAVHSVLIAAALAAAVPAFAQQPRIEDRLTAAEFRDAGLGKLSDAELARLNALLARGASTAPSATAAPDVEARIAQAREEGRREAQGEDHGLRQAASREPVESTIPGAFAGFARGREYTLANGQVWKQTDSASIAGARGQDIGVQIRPGFMGVWWLQVDGYNTRAKVERVR